MKTKKRILIAALVMVVVLGACLNAGASTGTPGSEVDPVVTKSYVDKIVKESAESAAKEAAEAAAKSAVTEELDETVKRLEETAEKVAREAVETAAAEGELTPGSTAFTVLNVAAGESIIGQSGTEIIVRSGTAKVVASGSNGLCDVTGGVDITSGKTVSQNHLLLCPRDDGRGIFAATELWVMIRGDYTLE